MVDFEERIERTVKVVEGREFGWRVDDLVGPQVWPSELEWGNFKQQPASSQLRSWAD